MGHHSILFRRLDLVEGGFRITLLAGGEIGLAQRIWALLASFSGFFMPLWITPMASLALPSPIMFSPISTRSSPWGAALAAASALDSLASIGGGLCLAVASRRMERSSLTTLAATPFSSTVWASAAHLNCMAYWASCDIIVL